MKETTEMGVTNVHSDSRTSGASPVGAGGWVPEVLASGHFYASGAVVGSALNIPLLETSIRPAFASAFAAASIFAVRMLSIRYGWGLPKFEIDDDGQGTGRAASGWQGLAIGLLLR